MIPMAAMNVRDLRDHTLAALKRRARAHHRSLQGEVRAILEEAAARVPPEGGYPPIRLHHVAVGGRRPLRREDLYGDNGR
jgi:plasmid stability protein